MNLPNFFRVQSVVILNVFVIFLVACGGSLELNSGWPQQELTIDGKQEDWQDAMTFVEKKNVSIGVANDGEFLYLCLVSTDRNLQRQILIRGFVLWLDSKGGKDKIFGIKFPIGIVDSGIMQPGMIGGGRDRSSDAAMGPERMKELLDQATLKLEILGPEENDRKRYSVSELSGVEVKIGDPTDRLVYEIKVPLYKSDRFPVAIGLTNQQKIGLGFETVKLDMSALRERMGGGMRGGRGGMGGGRGGMRGGRGAMGGDRSRWQSDFSLWIAAKLGSEDQTSTARLEIEETQ